MEPYSNPRILQVSTNTANTHLGHPAQASITTRATLASQPFLGCNTLSVNMMVQANQCHLASATVTLPRQLYLVSYSSAWGNQCHGPAIHPPSLPHGPWSISDCTYVVPDSNGANVLMIWVRAVIYLPLPPTNSRVSCPNQYLYLYFSNQLFREPLGIFSTVTCGKRLRHSSNTLN